MTAESWLTVCAVTAFVGVCIAALLVNPNTNHTSGKERGR